MFVASKEDGLGVQKAEGYAAWEEGGGLSKGSSCVGRDWLSPYRHLSALSQLSHHLYSSFTMYPAAFLIKKFHSDMTPEGNLKNM